MLKNCQKGAYILFLSPVQRAFIVMSVCEAFNFKQLMLVFRIIILKMGT